MRILLASEAGSIHTRRWAAAFAERGHDVCVASFRPAEVPGARVEVLPTYGAGRAGYFLALPHLRRLWRDFAPDVVHAQYVTSYGFICALARLRPLVVTAWGSDVLLSPAESRVARALVSYALRRADAVTTVAQHMDATVVTLGADARRVQAVPFGIDTGLFRLPDAPPPEDGVPRVICTRNFQPVYAVNDVLDAVAAVRRRGIDLHLDLTGDGPLREALQAQARSLGIEAVTTFHGHVPHPTLVGLLQRAQVFVTPALSDGNNVSLNEAMGCGAFPIGTRIPANAQWIEHGDNGLLYPSGDSAALADCLERACRDHALRAAARARNREIVVERADWQRGVDQMLRIFQRVRGTAAQ